MLALVVTIDIMPGRREAFLEAMLDDARGSLQNEPGCLRFDVVQDSENPNRIYLYEVYRDKAALEGHRRSPHYLSPMWMVPKEALLGSPAPISIGAFVTDELVHLHHGSSPDDRYHRG